MKRNFAGIAVYSEKSTLVGVWLPGEISPKQRNNLLRLNQITEGHVLVGANSAGNTAVKFLGRHIGSATMARRAVMKIVKAVTEVTGIRSILRQLPNYKAVSRTLAS